MIVTAINEYGIRSKGDKKITLSLIILYCLTQISGFMTLSNHTLYLNLICWFVWKLCYHFLADITTLRCLI